MSKEGQGTFLASPNCDARTGPVDTIVLHYTGMRDAASAIARLCDPVAAVSSHYVVEEDGRLWQLVDEGARAFHAGVSFWRGRTALNSCSIGIEIVNPGHEFGYRRFADAQMAKVRDLCLDLQRRHPIAARNVVAHSDVAPDRKQDPGELFDWAWLAAAGVGLWPAGPVATERGLADLLETIGYNTALPQAVRAFQLHWQPWLLDGVGDAETAGIAQAVVNLLED